MIYRIGCLLVALLLTSCTSPESKALARTFNTKEFVGLVSTKIAKYEDAVLDYELDTSSKGIVKFTNCMQVEAADEGNIEASQYSLFKLLSANCLALKRYVDGKPAQRSYFPAQLTEALVAAFPATAAPSISKEDMKRRQGKTLSAYETKLKISVVSNNVVQVSTVAEDMTYYIMGRADFDGDGTEDILVRVDWHAHDALGRGTDLFILGKISDVRPITVIWRPYVIQ